MTACDIAIVGAGPAGLSAAREAAALGCSVTLIDDNPRPGGQYLRQPPSTWREAAGGAFAREGKRAQALLGVVDRPGVEYLPDAIVWDLPAPGVLAVAAGGRSGRIAARAIVLATGARDRPVPFPGWTLPGVITAGGAQNLMKSQRVLPGRRLVVAGNGPLLLVTAASLVALGAKVVAVVEAAPVTGRVLGVLPAVLRAPGLLALGLRYRALLARAGVPYLAGWTVLEAHGGAEVEAVDIAPFAQGGGIERSRQRRLEADTLIAGFGLVPSDQLARLAGCEQAFDRRSGEAITQRDEALMTSVPNLYAAGDGTAIGGVETALVEGALAGLAAAARLGHKGASEERRRRLERRRARLGAFAGGLARVFAPPLGVADLLTGGTVVCRCEDLTLGDIDRRRDEGATSMLQLKAATRIGMGRCQGRNCLATLAAIVAGDPGGGQKQGPDQGVEAQDWPRPRAPARPIRLADLRHEEIASPAMPDDPHLPRGGRHGEEPGATTTLSL